MRAYFLAAKRESASDLAPVTTIFPEAKTSAVVPARIVKTENRATRYNNVRRAAMDHVDTAAGREQRKIPLQYRRALLATSSGGVKARTENAYAARGSA